VKIATCSWRGFRPEMGIAVGISRGVPTFPLDYRYVRLPILQPDGWMFSIASDDEFNHEYRKKLGRIGTRRIAAELGAISSEAGGRTLVLLCFERLEGPNDMRCHRRVFARFWEERTGQHVPELGRRSYRSHNRQDDTQGRLF
jgi:hypothetical protein